MKNLKVLMLNGSPHVNGNTAVALREMEEIFKASGVEVETVLIGNQAVRGCTACGACGKLGKCVFDDVVNELKPKFEEADGLVVASPSITRPRTRRSSPASIACFTAHRSTRR